MIMAQASMAQQDKPAYVILQTMMQKYDVAFTQENLDGADWGSPKEEGLTSKPFDEDLSIFGVEGYVVKNPENIAKEAIKAYFATDPFEIGLSQQEYWDKYGFDVIISSSTIAETMGIYLKEKEAARKLRIACYEFKKGGFLVICSESMTQKVEMFSFKDGKLTPLPNAFPQFDSDQIKSLSPSAIILESGYYIDHFTYDGLEIHRTNFDMDTETMSIINHGDTVTFFKWDGEKFIKQQ